MYKNGLKTKIVNKIRSLRREVDSKRKQILNRINDGL